MIAVRTDKTFAAKEEALKLRNALKLAEISRATEPMISLDDAKAQLEKFYQNI